MTTPKTQRTARLPRGIRSNNPGNIRIDPKTKWQGAIPGTDAEFVTFKSPEFGVRALARLLITYYQRYKLDTVQGIINRWAPAKGDRNGPAPGGEYRQDTTAYVRAVARAVGVLPDDELDVDSWEIMRPLVVAIIAHECAGYACPAKVIDDGLRLAGIADAPPPKMTEKPEAVGGVVVAAGSVGAVCAPQAIEAAKLYLAPVAATDDRLRLAFVVLTLIGAAWIVFEAWRRTRRTGQ